MSQTASKFATNVLAELEKREWSCSHLARAAGIGSTTATNISQARTESSTRIIEAVAEAFGKKPWEMLK